MHIQPGTIARSLLSVALDDADPDARNVAELLDGIPGALARAELGGCRPQPPRRSRSMSCSAWLASNWPLWLLRISNN